MVPSGLRIIPLPCLSFSSTSPIYDSPEMREEENRKEDWISYFKLIINKKHTWELRMLIRILEQTVTMVIVVVILNIAFENRSITHQIFAITSRAVEMILSESTIVSQCWRFRTCVFIKDSVTMQEISPNTAFIETGSANDCSKTRKPFPLSR